MITQSVEGQVLRSMAITTKLGDCDDNHGIFWVGEIGRNNLHKVEAGDKNTYENVSLLE